MELKYVKVYTLFYVQEENWLQKVKELRHYRFYSSAVVRDGKMENPIWGTAIQQLCYKHVAGFMELQFRERELTQPLWEKGKEDFVFKFFLLILL